MNHNAAHARNRLLGLAAPKVCSVCGDVFTKHKQNTYARYAAKQTCSKRGCLSVAKSRRQTVDLQTRFEEKYIPEPNSGCWLWIATTLRGYGQIQSSTTDGIILAHRAAWQIYNGPIPAGMCVLHRCDNPSCVNPAHLRLGSIADNNADMAQKGRASRGEQHFWAKLTENDIRQIRLRSESLRYLAEEFGVAQSTILDAKRRVTWKHVI